MLGLDDLILRCGALILLPQLAAPANKLAELVILSANPLRLEPMLINKFVVLETIKNGRDPRPLHG